MTIRYLANKIVDHLGVILVLFPFVAVVLLIVAGVLR